MAAPLLPPDSPPGALASWEELMRLALGEADKAAEQGEVPVGAVLLGADGEILSQTHNSPIGLSDPTAHAEIRALRQAGRAQDNYRLPGSILAVTVEPCLMCFGAIIHARVAGIVYGAPDPKTGAVASRLDGPDLDFLNHRPWVIGNILANECAARLTRFFAARREG